jgi:hypothetical protein
MTDGTRCGLIDDARENEADDDNSFGLEDETDSDLRAVYDSALVGRRDRPQTTSVVAVAAITGAVLLTTYSRFSEGGMQQWFCWKPCSEQRSLAELVMQHVARDGRVNANGHEEFC